MNMPMLSALEGKIITLAGHAVQASLHDTLALIEVTQTYRNNEETNIEAVYTFPLPAQAQLLDLNVTLGDRRLTGVVVAKKEAEESYEKAVAKGDTAIMLEQPQPGLFTMNVGNLMAGETAVIKMSYALLLSWEGRCLRLALPTTVAPRYGSWEEGGVHRHQVPAVDPLFEQSSSISVLITGALAGAQVSSPTHAVSTDRMETGLRLALTKVSTWMDRDFVLDIQSDQIEAISACHAPDPDGHVAYASLRLPPREQKANGPGRSVKLVIDCSGSMAGDSISQARDGALGVLAELRPQDEVGAIAFGGTAKGFVKKMLPATPANLRQLGVWIERLNADMGGTEMEAALELAFSLSGKSAAHDVLLITDGEISNPTPVIKSAKKSGHRIFAVGVGASPVESLLRGIGEATGGATVFATPNEEMSKVIQRHFRRISQPRTTSISITWPQETLWQAPEALRTVFVGDTVHCFAGFLEPPKGAVALRATFDDESTASCEATLVAAPIEFRGEPITVLARLAASRRLVESAEQGFPVEVSTKLAEKYQLLSLYTNFIAVLDRGAGAAGVLPELRKVGSMLAAGWGGAGAIGGAVACMRLSEDRSTGNFFETRVSSYSSPGGLQWDDDIRNIPAFLRSAEEEPAVLAGKSPEQCIEAANNAQGSWWSRAPTLHLHGSNGLDQYGVPVEIIADLKLLVQAGGAEADVVLAFWMVLLESSVGDKASRALRRALIRRSAKVTHLNALIESVRKVLIESEAVEWGSFAVEMMTTDVNARSSSPAQSPAAVNPSSGA